jgi:hypothetical protein
MLDTGAHLRAGRVGGLLASLSLRLRNLMKLGLIFPDDDRIARTRACFESARRGLFDDSFLSDIVEILCSVGVASCAATTEARTGRKPEGQDPGRASGALRGRTSDALFPAEVQSFLDYLMAGFR